MKTITERLAPAAFAVGLAVLAWVAWGYAGSHPLALAITLLITACYLAGALELRRYHQATTGLDQALAKLTQVPAALDGWLAQLHPTLQQPVRLRIAGQRVGLPGPAMTPYLVGLLVLLGMLGTFAGLVVTLHGTVAALESTTDLAAMRAALAAPVKGLGLAFGTSIAGVAASAMLGLMSALARRARLQAAQTLDGRVAGTLRVFSAAHQRDEAFEHLRLQAQVVPALAGQLQTLMGQLAAQGQALNTQLLAGQTSFHQGAQTAYSALADSVAHSLKSSLTESARQAEAMITPVVQATMAGIARDTAALQQHTASLAQQQLDALTSRFDASMQSVTGRWQAALAGHQQATEAWAEQNRAALTSLSAGVGQQSAALLTALSESQAKLRDELGRHEAQRLATLGHHESTRLAALAQAEADHHATLAALELDRHDRSAAQELQRQTAQDQRHAELLATLGASQAQRQAEAAEVEAQRQAEHAAAEQQRQAVLAQAMHGLVATLQQAWQAAATQSQGQHDQVCSTLAATAQRIQAQAGHQGQATLHEVQTLVRTVMHSATDAPRAAAELIGQLRQQHSDSLLRDNQLLDERSRIMAALGELLGGLQQARGAQQDAIDRMVSASAQMLEQAGQRFSEQIDAQTGTLSAATAQITTSAVDVASLGDAFGSAVDAFGGASQALGQHLQQLETALAKAGTRSDEQLAYYVAQARELIDLSLLSQKQTVDALQQAERRQRLAGEAA